MRVVRTVDEMAAAGGGDLGFVPTMGAFHEGHLSLMREARGHHQTACVSLFVNPLQFGKNEDLNKYPRDEKRDFELAAEHGVDIMFAPAPSEIYPRQGCTIHIPQLGDVWEGQIRPGHFDGVATVVCKLFNIVRPKVAYFGWKDFQQCLVIRRMVDDLNLKVGLQFLETVREADGLAMSSRNVYLSPEDRLKAPKLYGTLLNLAAEADLDLESRLKGARVNLDVDFDVDYLEFVDLVDMKPKRTPLDGAFIVAARLGTTRLIDNIRI